MAVPLRLDHSPLISGRGVIANLGKARHFSVIKEPVFGLLCVAEVDRDRDGHGDDLLHDIRCMLAQRWLPPGWGMSIGCHTDGETVLLPHEVSLTRTPAFRDALVLNVGAESAHTYEVRTGIKPLRWADVAPRP